MAKKKRSIVDDMMGANSPFSAAAHNARAAAQDDKTAVGKIVAKETLRDMAARGVTKNYQKLDRQSAAAIVNSLGVRSTKRKHHPPTFPYKV